MEWLNHYIASECEARRWRPLTFGRNELKLSHLFFADDLILFAEASNDQMEEIRSVMSEFCVVSRHRINMDKSKMFVSQGVHFNRATELSQKLGIGLTGDLGKYLGVPVLHKRITKGTFKSIVLKTRKKLSAWKCKHLTIAGRYVLIKSVLAVIPSYQMQSMLLPVGTVNELEKISRNFLWAQDSNLWKPHLIEWHKVLNDRKNGSLGFKSLRVQNQAFMMKLCWGLLSKGEAMWVKCLKAKYGCGTRTWQGITTVWERFSSGVGRKIRGGQDTKF